ncbi:MAG: argininosuccinate lyase [Gammaproteobacteria bacterium]
MKLWSGCFSKQTHHLVEEYNASIQFDYRLAPYDLQGSWAHVSMLGKCNLLPADTVDLIQHGLRTLFTQYQNNALEFSIADEDIHMNIERLLYNTIGEAAGHLHMGRSRNDQVALDLHLYVRHQCLLLVELLQQLQITLIELATQHIDTLMPGYTHLQRAEPIRLAHYFLAYHAMFNRDQQRLIDTFQRVNICPLGAGALAGSGLPIDRDYVAQLLGFDDIYHNSLDAVSDRDFVVEYLAHSALIMMHLSKLSEEIIIWSSQEFGFITLDDAFSTGSSMMPQKKNPDVAELARAKTGRVYGALMGLLTVLKGLPLAYNKDLQEDKEGLFDSIDTLQRTLKVFIPMLHTMRINTDTMLNAAQYDFANATQLANYLVKQGLRFREAHHIVGQIVKQCDQQGIYLMQLPLADYQQFSPLIKDDVFEALSLEQVIETHTVIGGTSRHAVETQLQHAQGLLAQHTQWLASKQDFKKITF